jgi:hypothetical protein
MLTVANCEDFLVIIQIVTKKMFPKVFTTKKQECPNVPRKDILLLDCTKPIVIECIVLLNSGAVEWSTCDTVTQYFNEVIGILFCI